MRQFGAGIEKRGIEAAVDFLDGLTSRIDFLFSHPLEGDAVGPDAFAPGRKNSELQRLRGGINLANCLAGSPLGRGATLHIVNRAAIHGEPDARPAALQPNSQTHCLAAISQGGKSLRQLGGTGQYCASQFAAAAFAAKIDGHPRSDCPANIFVFEIQIARSRRSPRPRGKSLSGPRGDG